MANLGITIDEIQKISELALAFFVIYYKLLIGFVTQKSILVYSYFVREDGFLTSVGDYAPPLFVEFNRVVFNVMEYISNADVFSILLGTVITIGTINWAVWFIRRTRSIHYREFDGEYDAFVSVVIPVYKEDLRILRETINSILKNNPNELILVLDHTEVSTMNMIRDFYSLDNRVKAYYIFKPGKRPALASGIRRAKGDIVVLVDSDTQWVSDNFLRNLIKPFRDPSVGGVGTRQAVRVKRTAAQRLIDWILDIKYTDYIRSDSLSGSVLCLSGRTAAYRREVVLPLMNDMENEYFLWHKCVGGDDARLTSLVLREGYKTVYQDSCLARSEFSPSLTVYLRQKIRWSRNSFRTYIKNLFSSWPWKQKRNYYIMASYHTIVPGLALLIGLGLFAYTLYIQYYLLSAIFFFWSFISRGIKSYSHLRKEPRDFILLPYVVFYFIILSFIKVYALLTLTRESWSGSRGSYQIVGDVRKGKKVSDPIVREV